MELSRTAYVILGMLRLGRRTGYEIKSFMDVSTRFFWAASYGQIYPELRRLEQAGLIQGEADEQSGRRRRAYELTPAGEEALHDWLASDRPPQFELRHEGVLRLFFADALDPSERADLVATVRREHERVRDELRAFEPQAARDCEQAGAELPLEVLRFGIAYQEFLIGWCRDAERRLASRRAA